MPKDKVGIPGEAINKRMYVYMDKDSDEQIRISVKEAAWDNAGLLGALGWSKTPIAGKAVIKETLKECVQDHGCVPVTIEYEDETSGGVAFIGTAKTVLAPGVDPDAFRAAVIGSNYHSTLNVVGAKVGWTNYPN